jgi:hypothetical protein
MEKKNWIAQAEDTIQVSEDEFRRKRITLAVTPETTVREIVEFYEKEHADLRTGILLLQLSKPQP